ncbi:bifunctional hydroxymethylpyrimidine kinase/phosphomethylpyrimidine kinase [Priestia aryabhattai]|uniref:bifunctional hydroxymethylpyrimidine kinase/phosphomethylpyrimidine kinase n=1 Tax=Priestia TaxID=2800373 RepID=UPI000B9F9E62|nr:bifunctional hydroxymethylpyrimidine kinase/phosphomethylpyrimidine kinase [Priestia flexa]MBY6024281.1 bifunctional hydroxymethylpyrimidine kinase/phosphomethylpyrimidine kinase [Nitratireductor sp. DP7N14-4]MDT2048222.1 bifunctional hydroxymethylpyrimidine kinase/phosphomethylpyrimidine kinase [Priestia flexa]OZT11419.1 bifunctional hydroxymethylpyrimidine kinase/phosphomethylpyrimidine kinase [Priestia aryabhattai]USY55693.1 bifunctional hydroxymethylpyrimidine kinase/phosphomethylpyrimid
MSVAKALTIAGSDSGGGAGIQADLKTFQERKVFGMSAITAVTAQNTLGVQGVYPLTEEAIAKQIDSVVTDLRPDAIKTGMLFSSDIIRIVADKLHKYELKNVVVDPVMIAKGGQSLLQQEAIVALNDVLLPLSEVVTPNIPEAEIMTGYEITTMEQRREAAKNLHSLGVKNVVIKGGHDQSQEEMIDLVYDGQFFHEIVHKRVDTKHTHGTGCTFAACVAAELAKGATILEAVQLASDFVHAAIKDTLEIGNGHGPTNHWAYRKLT